MPDLQRRDKGRFAANDLNNLQGLADLVGLALAPDGSGGYLLGLIEVLALVVLGSSAQAGVAFAALFLMLVLRPQGLFGTQLREKV